MFAQHSRSRISRWILTSLAALTVAASASAINPPPPRRLTAPEELAVAIERMETATEAAVARIDVLADRAIFKLERSALKGASQASLEKTARSARKSFASQARGGSAQLVREVGRAMIRMRSAAEYTRDLQDDLFFERFEDEALLEDAYTEAVERVDAALADLTGAPAQ